MQQKWSTTDAASILISVVPDRLFRPCIFITDTGRSHRRDLQEEKVSANSFVNGHSVLAHGCVEDFVLVPWLQPEEVSISEPRKSNNRETKGLRGSPKRLVHKYSINNSQLSVNTNWRAGDYKWIHPPWKQLSHQWHTTLTQHSSARWFKDICRLWSHLL